MSDDTYDDIISNESNGINRERVEMTVDIYESADCVRGDDFKTETNTHEPIQRTGSDSVTLRSSRASTVCLGLLCVLLLTAVIALSVHIYTNSTKYTKQRNKLLTNITNLTEERDELMKQRDQLQQEKNDLQKHLCEMGGWIYHLSSFYFMSTEKKSWTDSRRYCTERGAHLIIINNREEQDLVNKISHGTAVWIGLTDSDENGKWKWVDGTNMTSGFWRTGEPNGRNKENCVVYYLSGWADYPCGYRFHFICEKSILKCY